MNFIARIVRYLFWLVVVYWGVALLRRAVAWMLRDVVSPRAQGAASGPQTERQAMDTPGGARRLVRDPVCGMHVSEHIAIPLRVDGELVHFCSAECRDKYEGGKQKRAASA